MTVRMKKGALVSAPIATIVRPDGTLQLAYNNHPLYNYTVRG